MKNEKSPETSHKQGPPWRTVYRASSYAEADLHRVKLVKEWDEAKTDNMQVKVKWMSSTDSFIVKTRKDPSVSSSKEKKTKRPPKKSKKN